MEISIKNQTLKIKRKKLHEVSCINTRHYSATYFYGNKIKTLYSKGRMGAKMGVSCSGQGTINLVPIKYSGSEQSIRV